MFSRAPVLKITTNRALLALAMEELVLMGIDQASAVIDGQRGCGRQLLTEIDRRQC